MNLEQLKDIDELLEKRAYIIATLDNLNLAEFNCISMRVYGRLGCVSKIKDEAIKANYELAVNIYDIIVDELNEVNDELISLGVEVQKSSRVSGKKKLTFDALKSKIEYEPLNAPICCPTIAPKDDGVYIGDMRDYKFKDKFK